MVTLFHWDTPSAFNGDWLNEEIVEHFGAYARICFQAFGDRVKTWITLNEPFVYSILAYHHGIFAPGKNAEPAAFPYLSVHNMLKAHAEAYHIYQKEFKEGQKGRVGISVDSWWYHPADPNSKPDLEATERALQFRVEEFAHTFLAIPFYKGPYLI
jgi:beta-glucosidase/6-phospho-beta-glucosidase/beta-galactosidase